MWFATVAPPYLDKTNATVVQAALRLPVECGAYDLVGSVRGAMGALRAAACQPSPALAVAADVRTGLAGGPDESYFGDGAAALVLGGDDHGEVLAELGPWVSVTGEFSIAGARRASNGRGCGRSASARCATASWVPRRSGVCEGGRHRPPTTWTT